MRLTVTKRQKAFLDATATEVLFGGAAGGGKSRGQLIDAFLFALTHPASKQLILRRTFPELEKSLIRESLALYPKSVYTYHATGHTGRFPNGSLIDFGYCATENDVFQYQSAEYDVIRFDELTHFTEFQYLYLMSRVRGANRYPKQIKSSTNPGGVGHGWVKARFIDPAPPDTVFTPERGGSRIFLPAKLEDNRFLLRADPAYRERLLALPERERRALLLGDWNIFDGQYFGEFSIPATRSRSPPTGGAIAQSTTVSTASRVSGSPSTTTATSISTARSVNRTSSYPAPPRKSSRRPPKTSTFMPPLPRPTSGRAVRKAGGARRCSSRRTGCASPRPRTTGKPAGSRSRNSYGSAPTERRVCTFFGTAPK